MITATREVLSPHYYSNWRGSEPPKVVIIHSTRSGQQWSDEEELQSALNWFTSPTSQVSAHWVISETERVRVVLDENAAWHASEHNLRAYGIELTQPTRGHAYQDGHYNNLVMVARHYLELGVLPIHLLGYFNEGEISGFVAHENTGHGQRVVKSDPGAEFDWDRFLNMLNEDPYTRALFDQLLQLNVPIWGGTEPVTLNRLLHSAYHGSPTEHQKLLTQEQGWQIATYASETRAALEAARATLESHIREHNQSGGIIDRFSGAHLEELARLLNKMEEEVNNFATSLKS